MNRLPGRLVLLGHPVAHSLSPTFQNAALQRAELPLTYEAFDIEPRRLAEAVARLRAIAAAGNVTVPHKEAFAAHCDRLTPIAERVGAVNTFWTEDDVLVGDNTDVGGFVEAVSDAFGASRAWRKVALLGAGGAAAAVAAAVERWPACQLSVWSRTAQRGQRLKARFPETVVAARVEAALDGADLVVNATPLGLHAGDELPAPVHLLPPRSCVYDLTYGQLETAWILAARAAGHPAVDGLGMLIHQGALAFERWFGIAPDRKAMWASVRS
ncbi:MAG: shikimate dehydrogenase [Gemmatimonadetes bacterium]|nr:shikimate dehydrogenase [Gemmatimonadota bacterium]